MVKSSTCKTSSSCSASSVVSFSRSRRDTLLLSSSLWLKLNRGSNRRCGCGCGLLPLLLRTCVLENRTATDDGDGRDKEEEDNNQDSTTKVLACNNHPMKSTSDCRSSVVFVVFIPLWFRFVLLLWCVFVGCFILDVAAAAAAAIYNFRLFFLPSFCYASSRQQRRVLASM